MNAIDLLKKQHDEVRDLFKEYDRERSNRQDVADEILVKLEIHSRLEEDIFYPALQAKARGEEKELVLEAKEEHRIVDQLVEELKGMTVHQEEYQPRFTVLRENVEHHLKEEETEMLPDAERRLGRDAERLGEQMEQRNNELMRSME